MRTKELMDVQLLLFQLSAFSWELGTTSFQRLSKQHEPDKCKKDDGHVKPVQNVQKRKVSYQILWRLFSDSSYYTCLDSTSCPQSFPNLH